MRGDDRARVDDGETERLRVLLRGRLDPIGVEAERRVFRLAADDLGRDAARIDREVTFDVNLALADRHAQDRDAVRARA